MGVASSDLERYLTSYLNEIRINLAMGISQDALIDQLSRSFSKFRRKMREGRLNLLTSKSAVEHMGYRSGARAEHLTSKGYLEYLDQRLGFSRGTLYGLCLAAVKSKTETKRGLKVTYRGETERQIRVTGRIVQVRKAIFLIEFKMTKAGKQTDRVVQVHLEV